MLESSEHEKLWLYSNYESPNFKDFSKVRSADPLFFLETNFMNRGP